MPTMPTTDMNPIPLPRILLRNQPAIKIPHHLTRIAISAGDQAQTPASQSCFRFVIVDFVRRAAAVGIGDAGGAAFVDGFGLLEALDAEEVRAVADFADGFLVQVAEQRFVGAGVVDGRGADVGVGDAGVAGVRKVEVVGFSSLFFKKKGGGQGGDVGKQREGGRDKTYRIDPFSVMDVVTVTAGSMAVDDVLTVEVGSSAATIVLRDKAANAVGCSRAGT